MKSKILLFLTLITYTFTKDAAAVTLSSVATGSCKDKKYTFVIKANADGDLKAGSATVTLSSPASTTPTCTFEAVTGPTTRRLAAGDFDITCVITSKLENAEIKVNAVAIGTITATVANSGTFPLSMTGAATCEGTTTTTTTTTTNTDSNTTDAGKFIQISAFLFLFILTVF
jgi:hypothetical protein